MSDGSDFTEQLCEDEDVEDEQDLLEKYGLIAKSPKGKYQTDLVIFTEDFTEEFHKAAEKIAVPALGQIVSDIRKKLGQIREINAVCKRLSDLRLLWGLLWPVMLGGHKEFARMHPEGEEKASYSIHCFSGQWG